jgi:HAE1 family hydrophobic/amphiphilic exporter-1
MADAAKAPEPAEAKEGGIGVAALFVGRPVLAVVLNLLIVIAGLAAFSGIEIRELPNIDQPVITVRTTYEGATPETIDKQITAIIEGAVARTPGVVSLSSQSSSGSSQVTIQFDDSTDLDVAANDVRDAIGGLKTLPEDADAPVIVKADANSDPIMRIAATSPSLPIEELTQVVNDRVVDRLAAVEGVADVQLRGDRDPVMRINIDPDALAARRHTVADLLTALGNVALDAPAGSVRDANRSLLVRADASVKSPEEIEAIAIDPATRVGDVASVVLGPSESATALRINGRTGAGISIIRQAKSNALEISSGIRKAVDELNASLPDGVRLRITSDDATFIRGSIHEVVLTLFLATAIVIAIIYVFLRSLRVTFIPAVTVPIALVGAFAAIWAAGFSLNILTLLALVLATGIVVDDAIVVIENIARQRALGLGPRAAAVIGTRQVFFAVLSTTATLAAVFIPISFFPGVAGRLFSEFGFVLAFAVTLSAFVALTLGPMLAARLMTGEAHRESRNPVGRALTSAGRAAERVYARLLDQCLKAPYVAVAAAVLFAGAAGLAFTRLPSELTPPEDRGSVPMALTTPQGATVEYTTDQIRRLEAIVQPLVDRGEVTNVFATAQSSSGGGGFMFLTLAPWAERSRTQMEISAGLSRAFQDVPGIQVIPRTSNSLGIRGGGQGVTFSVTGSDYAALAEAADGLKAALEKAPAFDTVRLNYDTTQPQIEIGIDRARAADVGVSVGTITKVVQTLLDGEDLGDFYRGDDPIEILAVAPEGMIQDPVMLENIQLRTAGGKMVPLSSLVSFKEVAVAPTLLRQDQMRAVPMTATLAPGVDLRKGMDALEAVAAGVLPAGMGIVYSGEARELNTASGGVTRTFIFALIVVLLVLAAQFESFNSALILIATVPFGLAAAVFAMVLTGGSLNIYSQIGLVMLVGLMSKNGILIVEFANQLRDAGQSVQEAIRNASVIRLRPVVMTMISTVLGGLPLLLTGGAGAEARHALGWIIVGGLGFATIATLFLTPVVYGLLARFSRPRVAEAERLARELAEAANGPRRGLEPTAEERGLAGPVRVAAE